MQEAWYIAKSKPQREGWLISCLEALGVEVFFPRMLRKRRGKRILEPLFPTYLFGKFDIQTPDWPAIRWAPGLNYFLGIDGRPSQIPEELVDFVKERVRWWNEQGFHQQDLQSGDRVIVSEGPFAGIAGIFQTYVNSRQRCRILLQQVGRLSAVEIPEAELEIVAPRI